jgi:putative membrane protein
MAAKSLIAGVIALGLAGAPALALAQPATTSLTSSDKKFVTEAAEGGQMEVELGELAQQKAATDAVRQFGRRMVDDHGKANHELAQLAASKQVQLSDKASRHEQREKDRLSKLSGAAFDREYVKMMVADHEKDVAVFKRESQQAKDPDLKTWAGKTLPTLEDHLQMIRQVQGQLAKK